MATAEQLKALIRSHAEGDDTRFYAVAMHALLRRGHAGGRQGRLSRRSWRDSSRCASPPPC